MSSNSDKPLKSLLLTNLEQLKNLYDADTKKHQAELSDILFWLATNHPNELDQGCLELGDLDYIKVRRLYFRDSWVNPDEPLPTDGIVTLLNSDICRELKTFCGYVNPNVLDHFNQLEPLRNVRLALTKHINVRLLIEKLNERRVKHYNNEDIFEEEELAVHLRSRELDLKDLAPLPDVKPTLYITEVKDQDADWVVQVAIALKPKIDPSMCINPEISPMDQMSYPYIESLYLPHSKLTAAGVEAIAKGLFEAGISLSTFAVSSPYFNDDDDVEIPGYEDEEDFCVKISEKYKFDEMYFDDDKGMDFKDHAAPIYEEEDLFDDNKYYYGLC